MDAKVTWKQELQFTGVANSGFAVQMDSHPSVQTGASPMEMVAMALAGCTAMDVISILTKKRQDVTAFHTQVHAERSTEQPTVFTSAVLEYVVTGHGIAEDAVRVAIDRSVKKYCPVHAMLKHAFPIEVRFSILEDNGTAEPRPVLQGVYEE